MKSLNDKEVIIIEIYIYFSTKLTISLDIIEDAIDELLNGNGEVTGTGTGESGSNIDIEILEGNPADYVVLIKNVLNQLQVPNDTIIKFNNETYYIL